MRTFLKSLLEFINGLFILLLLGAMLLLYPLLLPVIYLSYWVAWRSGLNLRIEEPNLVVYSLSRGVVRTLVWLDIAKVKIGVCPPITYLILVLRTGEEIHLESASLEKLQPEFISRGIVVDQTNMWP